MHAYHWFTAISTVTVAIRSTNSVARRGRLSTPLSGQTAKRHSMIKENLLQRYFFMVFSNPVAGQENEFDSWYREVHIPDLLTLSGFVRAQRLYLSATQISGHHPHSHAVIYEIETRDIHATFNELKKKLKDGSFATSTAIDHTTLVSHVYTTLD